MRRVMVVVPTLNEAKTISNVLGVLRTKPIPLTDIQIVVVDGGSTDGTQNIVEGIMKVRPDVHFLYNPKRTQSAAVNLAAKTFGAKVDVLVRCDAHAVYPAGYVTNLLKTLDLTGADAVVVPMDSIGTTCFQKGVAWVSDTIVGSGGSAHRGGKSSGFVDHGHHAAIQMASFLNAGGYDETFTHNEDAELDCRQSRFGSRIYLDGETRVGYLPRSNANGLWRQYFAYGYGRSRTIRRHPGSIRLRQFVLPTHVLVVLSMLIASVWLPWLIVWPAFYAFILLITTFVGIWHMKSICGFFSGIAAAVMHVSWACGFFAGMAFTRQAAWHPSTAQNENPAQPEAQP